MARWLLTVNGKQHEIEAEPDMPLLWVLRDLLGLTGTKFSCGIGSCGSCNVHLGGELVPSCVVPISTASGQEVVTIEGLSSDNSHPVQRAWLKEQVSQCGYCQPGQIMAAVALLDKTPNPGDTDINSAMAGTLCRCGSYPRIRKAIHRAAQEGRFVAPAKPALPPSLAVDGLVAPAKPALPPSLAVEKK